MGESVPTYIPSTSSTTPGKKIEAADPARGTTILKACEILWKKPNIQRIASILAWISPEKFVNKNSWTHTLCCMDERICCSHWETNSKLAWSWILNISKIIRDWWTHEDVISFMKSLIEHNWIKKITSHENCWAAWLFCKELLEFWWISSDNLELIIVKLEEIFPWFNRFFSWTLSADNIAQWLLKYIATEVWVEHWHIMLDRNKPENLEHTARSVTVNLTDYDIPATLENFWINAWYVIDLWLFTDNPDFMSEALYKAIKQIAAEVIISKIIAKSNVWLKDEQKMHICFCYKRGDVKQELICKQILRFVENEINYWPRWEFRWLYDVNFFPVN